MELINKLSEMELIKQINMFVYQYLKKIQIDCIIKRTQMSELSKFINLLIEYGEKVEVAVNKKYKSFIRSVLNLEQLAKTVHPERVSLTKELIIFKLGLEAKSTKAIQISLLYLTKLFQMKFIDVNLPNYCEGYIIDENNVKECPVQGYQKQIRHELIRLIEPLLHFKSNEINQLTFKVLQFLIAEPILPLLLELCSIHPADPAYNILYNYFSFRFYVYEEIYTYTEAEMKSFPTLTLRTQKIEKDIRHAHLMNQALTELVAKYMTEYLTIITGGGGRYGFCIMCNEPADNYCKVTRASVCGLDCKKLHLELADKQYKNHFQAVNLWEAIVKSFEQLLLFLQKRESAIIFSVLVNLLEKPHLFMVIRSKLRNLIGLHSPNILSKMLQSKNQASFELIYMLVSSLAKYWMYECLAPIENFFKEHIIKVLEDKKPNYKILILVFKALARMMEKGKVTIQLYVNFDCEVNKDNIIEIAMFQIAKITQDKFASATHLTKQEKNIIKNSCVSLYMIMSTGLAQYQQNQPLQICIDQILFLKQKKTNLEKFTIKFNEHWTNGLKTLFNLNLVGLDSDEEIVDILLNLKGLKKDHLDELLFSQNGLKYLEIFLTKIYQRNKRNKLLSLIELHHYIPLKISSVGVKKFIMAVESYENTEEKEELERNKNSQSEEYILKWLSFLCKNYNMEEFKKLMGVEFPSYNEVVLEGLFMSSLESRQTYTSGNGKMYFTYCCSKSYLELFSSQLILLQIPISYLLETDYEIDRVIGLTGELIQICHHSNWISMLIKNCYLEEYPGGSFDENKFKMVVGIMDLIQKYADFIQDWSTIIQFMTQMHHILQKIQNKTLHQSNKVLLSEAFNIPQLEHTILEISLKINQHFSKYTLAILYISKDQIQKEHIFMMQKFFQILDANIPKMLLNIRVILPQLQKFTKELPENTLAEHCIMIADLIKQTFAKVLKHQQKQSPKIIAQHRGIAQHSIESKKNRKQDKDNQYIECQFLKIFDNLSSNRNKEVCDFVINCISMTILHHYELTKQSWTIIFTLMKKHVKEYRYQVYTIVEKIISEKMKFCEEFHHELLQICLHIIHPEECKISNQSLHAIRLTLEMFILYHVRTLEEESTETNNQIREHRHSTDQIEGLTQEQSEKQLQKSEKQGKKPQRKLQELIEEVKLVLKKVFVSLLSFVTYACHESILQILFGIFNIKMVGYGVILALETDILPLMDVIFAKIEELDGVYLMIKEKVLQCALTWSVKHKNWRIIQSLESLILNKKYDNLCFASMRCIKTYIQMINPKEKNEWKHIEESLFTIIKQLHIQSCVNLQLKDPWRSFFPQKENTQIKPQINIKFHDSDLGATDVRIFANQMLILKIVIELLPNDADGLHQLLALYNQVILFNDHIYLRCLLWRQQQAIRQKNVDTSSDSSLQHPPDLLTLEEVLSNRILAIYNWNKEDEVCEFALHIFKKYNKTCQESAFLSKKEHEILSSSNSFLYECYNINKNYLEKRKIPLFKIMNYLLPKMKKICKNQAFKREILNEIISLNKFVEPREPFLKCIKEITAK